MSCVDPGAEHRGDLLPADDLLEHGAVGGGQHQPVHRVVGQGAAGRSGPSCRRRRPAARAAPGSGSSAPARRRPARRRGRRPARSTAPAASAGRCARARASAPARRTARSPPGTPWACGWSTSSSSVLSDWTISGPSLTRGGPSSGIGVRRDGAHEGARGIGGSYGNRPPARFLPANLRSSPSAAAAVSRPASAAAPGSRPVSPASKVSALADMYSRHTRARPSLVSATAASQLLLEVAHPGPQGQRVVLAQRLHVEHLELPGAPGRDHLAQVQQLAVGEDVAGDEGVGARSTPRRSRRSRG